MYLCIQEKAPSHVLGKGNTISVRLLNNNTLCEKTVEQRTEYTQRKKMWAQDLTSCPSDLQVQRPQTMAYKDAQTSSSWGIEQISID